MQSLPGARLLSLWLPPLALSSALALIPILALASGQAHAAASALPGQPSAPLASNMPPQTRLAGEGSFHWYGFHIYDAQLWVGQDGYRDAAPAAAPFVLELRYARPLQGSRIAQASVEQMEKIGAGSAVQRQAWLPAMRALFPDVKEGDRLAGHFTPGQGMRFYFNGAPLQNQPTALTGEPFAQAFFAIWLSPRTTAPALRAALLRNAAPLP